MIPSLPRVLRLIGLTALIALGVPFRGLCAEAAHKPVKALILVGPDWRKFKVDPVLAGKFAAQGITFDSRNITEPLDAASLRSYPVVIVADWTGPVLGNNLRKFMEEYLTSSKNMALLVDYVAKGGGLFWIPDGSGVSGARGTNECLRPFGMGMEALQVRDDAHAFVTPRSDALPDEYGWTTEITPHPVTEGVSCIFYSMTQFRWDDLYSTPVLTFTDPAWQQVVKAMDTSVGAKGFDYTKWEPHTKQPAIAAVRDFQAGRMAVFAPNFLYTLYRPYDDPRHGSILEAHTGKIDGVVVEKGDGTRKSDGLVLMENIIKWLAENSVAKGIGAGEPAITGGLKPVPAPDWLYSWNKHNGTKWYKVLVGARSSFSDGQGTISDYAKAAKAAGIDMLVMTETFEKFDPARWQEFQDACANASDASLKVVWGLDIGDTYGARYILMNSPVFPAASMLTPDGKTLVKDQYLCLGFPNGTTILNRTTSSPIVNQMQKDFQGMSLYTYRNGKLVDNGLPNYEWQLFRLSNPLPFVVHETYSPKDLAAEAATGHQLYVSADSPDGLAFYLGMHGLAHFWESPLHMQVSDGPIISRFEGGGTASISIDDDAPITDVRLMENYNLYRRWTPNATAFNVDQVKLPDGHVNWAWLVATDAKGRTVVSPGIIFGRQIVHTWRCGDRQNWWCFPNIYTGTDLTQFSIKVPAFGASEGMDIFPEVRGDLRGDDMATILDFNYASPAVYIQDASLDERYFRAIFEDVAYDAKPAAGTIRSRVYEATARYFRFFIDQLPAGGKNDEMPDLKQVSITAREPLEPAGDIFPVFTTLDTKHAQVAGDMTYSYVNPRTGKTVIGRLTSGTLDLPPGGRVGGFIALSDGIRVGANRQVGFVPPAQSNGSLPVGTNWKASFITVAPDAVDKWRALMGLSGPTPYALAISKGSLRTLAYVADCAATDNLLVGAVTTALPKEFFRGLNAGLVDNNKEALGRPLDEYKLPIFLDGVNYNWPAFVWRKNGTFEPFDVFEGKGRLRLDVTAPGPFVIGNVITASDPNLRIGLLKWTAVTCDIEVNNASAKPVKAHIQTAAEITDRCRAQWDIDLAPGSSAILHRAKM